MASALRMRPYTSAPADGSRTITVRDSQPRDEGTTSEQDESSGHIGVLRLRGGPRRQSQRVAWGDDVVDNEGCGKKKSKICCIYHKPRRFDESSSEDSSNSDDDSDTGCSHHRHHHRSQSDRQAEGSSRNASRGGEVHQLEESEEQGNAYEMAPRQRKTRKQ